MSKAPLAPRRSLEQWEEHRPLIRDLYLDQSKQLPEVITILAESGFNVTSKQLKTRLKQWGIDQKNIRGETMAQIARTRAKRNAMSKSSGFRVNKQLVDNSKIERFIRRKGLTDKILLAATSPAEAPSPAFSVFTPAPTIPEDSALSPQMDDHSHDMLPPPKRLSKSNSLIARQRDSKSPGPPDRNYHAESPVAFLNAGSPFDMNIDMQYWPPNSLATPTYSGDIRTQPTSPALPFSVTPRTQHGDVTQAQHTHSLQLQPIDPTAYNDPTLDFFNLDILDRMESQLRVDDPEPPSGGWVYKRQEEEDLKTKLAMLEQELGPEHSDILDVIENLGTVYYYQRRLHSAEKMYRHVVHFRQHDLGNANITTLQTFIELTAVYVAQGRLLTAEKVLRQVLGVQMANNRSDPSVIEDTKFWLGHVLNHQEKYEESASVLREVLDFRQNKYGSEHVETLNATSELMTAITNNRGSYNDENLARNLLAIQKRILGVRDSRTIDAIIDLSRVLSDKGKHQESQVLLSNTISDLTKAFGEEYTGIVLLQHALAMSFWKGGGDLQNAISMMELAWSKHKRIRGEAHSQTLVGGRSFATILQDDGQYTRAEDVYAELSGTATRHLGANHPEAINILRHIGTLRENRGLHRESEEIHQEVLRKQRNVLPKAHPDIFESEASIGYSIGMQEGRSEEGIEILKNVLERCTTALGEEHRVTLITQRGMAIIIADQGRWDEAKAIFQDGLDKAKHALGIGHLTTQYYISGFEYYEEKFLGRHKPDDNDITSGDETTTEDGEVTSMDSSEFMEVTEEHQDDLYDA
ncbi:hypothetical protein B0O99DRAFT_602621 [Bisporella sp. PMI_857]|nr:hypothetical protein B0O99DRAFT_602621 [Bisporella sp. PMI_857]